MIVYIIVNFRGRRIVIPEAFPLMSYERHPDIQKLLSITKEHLWIPGTGLEWMKIWHSLSRHIAFINDYNEWTRRTYYVKNYTSPTLAVGIFQLNAAT